MGFWDLAVGMFQSCLLLLLRVSVCVCVRLITPTSAAMTRANLSWSKT